jgi:hypothetical protein
MSENQDHGELATEDRTARIGEVAALVEKNLSHLGYDSGTVATDNSECKMVHDFLQL